jgi:hypothetical protein
MSESNPPRGPDVRRGPYQGEQLLDRELRRAELRRSMALCQLADRDARGPLPTATAARETLAPLPTPPR